MDRLDVDRIRRVTFPMARRGYSKRAVHGFLDRLASWLESGEGDPARSDLLRRDLRRIGKRTSTILAEAEAAAERTREDAEREASRIVRRAREEAATIRGGPAPGPPPATSRPKRRPQVAAMRRPQSSE